MTDESLTEQIIGACIEVHRHVGPGLLESVYEHCLCHELAMRGLRFRRQLDLPIEYKGVRLDAGYRVDLVVEERVIIEIKSVLKMNLVFEAQLLTHLRLRKIRIGLLINFNVQLLKDGITRRVV